MTRSLHPRRKRPSETGFTHDNKTYNAHPSQCFLLIPDKSVASPQLSILFETSENNNSSRFFDLLIFNLMIYSYK